MNAGPRRPSLRAQNPTLRRSPAVFNFMAGYFARYFRRHMNALRLARWGEPDVPAGAGPLVIYVNHPSWWDAAIIVLAAKALLPDHATYAPFDAAMLAKYPVFGRIGAFPVDLDSPRGAAAFMTASAEILSRPERALWITAQGRFSDVRERPLGLKPGLARLAEIAPTALFLPLALEYAFWTERGAEAFLAFGPPRLGGQLLSLEREARLARLEGDLTETLDRLSADVTARDPERFKTMMEGRPGVGGVYDGWRRMTALLRGKRFEPAHARREP